MGMRKKSNAQLISDSIDLSFFVGVAATSKRFSFGFSGEELDTFRGLRIGHYVLNHLPSLLELPFEKKFSLEFF